MTTQRRRAVRAVSTLLVLIAATVVLTTTLGASPASSSAPAGHLHRGAGYTVAHGDFVGYYATSAGTKVYCLSPRKALPATVSLATLPRYPGVGAAASAQLAYALSRWGNAPSPYAAAVESQLLNTIVGNSADVARRAHDLPASIRAVVRAHLALAQQLHGGYVARVHTPKALLPGQAATGTVTVTSAAGHVVTGAVVRLAGSANVGVPSTLVTDAHGTAHFTYRVTGNGVVRLSVTALGLPPTQLRANHPGPGQQRMVSWSGAVTATAAASFHRVPSGISVTYECSTTCNGRPATTLTACAQGSAYPSRLTYRFGRQTRAVDFAAARVTVCRSVTVTTADGDRVSGAWQFRNARGWTGAVQVAGAIVVDCPAVPSVGVTMGYDCTDVAITVGLATRGAGAAWVPLVNTSRHRMVLVVAGAADLRSYAAPGHTATFTARTTCDRPVTFRVRAAVERSDGSLNYGPVAVVSTPVVTR